MFHGFSVPTPASLISSDPFYQGFCRRTKGGNKENESTFSSLSGRNCGLRVGKMVVFDGKMGMRKFGSAAPPFGKVACAVKVFISKLFTKGIVPFNSIYCHPSLMPPFIASIYYTIFIAL